MKSRAIGLTLLVQTGVLRLHTPLKAQEAASAARGVWGARGADIDYLQGVGGNEIGYSRAISTVGRAFILSHYRAYGGRKPPAIDHQAIDDALVGKASIVHNFHAGQWLDLTGAD